jgi:predicted Zn-dependent protease
MRPRVIIYRALPKFLKRLICALLSTSIILCSVAQASQFGNVKFWNIKELLDEPASQYQLNVYKDDGSIETYDTVSRDQLERLYEIKDRIQKAARTNIDIYLVTGKSPNAFATPITGRIFVAINVPMLKIISNDPDQMAALIGHEVAHLTEKHVQKNMQANENMQTAVDVIGIIVGGVLGAYGISNPLAGVGANTAIELLASGALMSFSRDQEREADYVGLKYATESGFNPNGATRLWSKMNAMADSNTFAIFSTHPSSQERIDNMANVIYTNYTDWHGKINNITQLKIATKVDYKASTHTALASSRPTVTDKVKRSPSLQEGVVCKLDSGETIRLPRITCIQKEGEIIK